MRIRFYPSFIEYCSVHFVSLENLSFLCYCPFFSVRLCVCIFSGESLLNGADSLSFLLCLIKEREGHSWIGLAAVGPV